MNYLQLCQQVYVDGGISGSLSTTVGVSGEALRVIKWVSQAWSEMQTKYDDWGFMKSSYLNPPRANGGTGGAVFETVNGQPVYPLGTVPGTSGIAVANFGKWDEESFRCYTTASGTRDEVFLDRISYEQWRNSYMYGALRDVNTRSMALAIAPDESSICLGPAPQSIYTIEGDYWVAPQLFSADADTPTGLPAQFHMLIAYYALLKYGIYESAADVISRAQLEVPGLETMLERKFGPKMLFAGPLA